NSRPALPARTVTLTAGSPENPVAQAAEWLFASQGSRPANVLPAVGSIPWTASLYADAASKRFAMDDAGRVLPGSHGDALVLGGANSALARTLATKINPQPAALRGKPQGTDLIT